ncbi:hypothetical protein EG68_12425 [Paragonimus skrjabini miyazakii]|uniref:Uncharacterized protein n=1 Tax=Paragonimus skrjabini miyazakii TaxID=59628 RepID=A0A8S9YJA0_9TREM|nr:hypothetical protein EG68_12425 [Paragonimus skrjabini miyazakii]
MSSNRSVAGHVNFTQFCASIFCASKRLQNDSCVCSQVRSWEKYSMLHKHGLYLLRSMGRRIPFASFLPSRFRTKPDDLNDLTTAATARFSTMTTTIVHLAI